VETHEIKALYTNHDYEPYATKRDAHIGDFLKGKGIELHTFKDQVLFEKSEIVKSDGSPYVVFTPYSRQWLKKMQQDGVPGFPSGEYLQNFYQADNTPIPSLPQMGFENMDVDFPSPRINPNQLKQYEETRNFPGLDNTTHLGVHLRFGTISARECISTAEKQSAVWLNELIWREFFMQILWHFPHVEKSAFRSAYDRINWRNDPNEFEQWCMGKTGFPLVDAGMRELNKTGFMHNRVRMVVAGFLTKHLLIDWRWGEAWFAEKLLDFELSANNGNWQWAAGSGCDAAPYFRIFNPSEQLKKFDKDQAYVKRWVPELDTPSYPAPIVDHAFARQRCLKVYADSLKP
jgi:deoxyribodipyrimidine photo-lyase